MEGLSGKQDRVLQDVVAAKVIDRGRGCMMGQIAGDSLGSLVEFLSADQIRARYPDGLRELRDGGTWATLAGQPTDDSELALMLARTLALKGNYDKTSVYAAYFHWLNSGPFDCGNTTAKGLRGKPDGESQSNGALMRISPLGIFGTFREPSHVFEDAATDAAITHPHPVCADCNSLFAMAIARAIKDGPDRWQLYEMVNDWAIDLSVDPQVRKVVAESEFRAPEVYDDDRQGWVLIAFGNALWQLTQATSIEEGVVDTVMRGGDTDTNAAICGALLGALYGLSKVPDQWVESVLRCRPDQNSSRPRPSEFWPCDALDLADQLLRQSDLTGLFGCCK